MTILPKGMDDYAKRHLIYHLQQAERWGEIMQLAQHPVFGEKAREVLEERMIANANKRKINPLDIKFGDSIFSIHLLDAE